MNKNFAGTHYFTQIWTYKYFEKFSELCSTNCSGKSRHYDLSCIVQYYIQ